MKGIYMKRYIKSFKMLFIAFVFMSLFYSLEISKFEQTKLKFIEENNFFTYESKVFHVDSLKIAQKSLIEVLDKYSDIVIQNKCLKYNQFEGSAIYFNSKPNFIPNMLNGRYFNVLDFKSNVPVSVIGKNMIDSVVEENDTKYLVLGDIRYEVIGVMGGENSSVNDKFIVNFNSNSIYNNIIDKESFYQVETMNKNINIISKLDHDLKLIDNSSKILMDSSLNIKNPITGYIRSRFYYLMFIIVVFVLSTINMASFYMSKRENEIGVLKAVGIKNNRIFAKILLEYEIVTIVSFIMGLLIHYTVYLVMYKNYLYYYININNVYNILFIAGITGFVTCLIPLIKLLKISPTYIMKR
ncbi:ABC transporter permease (plasmid) [Clostridium gasigenes]|uniref:ABC transporter permease n=1 Tax=Clostridium gasigenes TaxID=94869 RepID=UPI0014383C26|nr:ABC transporter permease [Clostridium gasigenes]NKF08826.1 ABC transporter permease [Clostridium gasigenes]QSW21536.1 ABC transporter permease [Clostridium gasigenes]